MTSLDYFVLIIYAIGMLLIGSILSRWNKNTADMFAVSRQSPWWLSGISAFMSAFSAGTFVVWGGIAFKHGFVSISILMSLGVSSFIVGKLLAGRWAKLGVTTIGEFINIRFGKEVVQFYTWIGMLLKLVAMSVALYSFATLFCALMPLDEGNIFRDAATGNLSITYACIVSGLLMLVYAVSGGLWAVLIIDSVQFVVLMVSVLFVVPLSFEQVGGVKQFLEAVPEGFMDVSNGQFTYWFLVGWVVVHTFKFGGEWVFVQRFLAVKNAKEAKKTAYLLGTLYLVSPVIWMLPAMIYRVEDPLANPEQAYFLACAAVLPAGMMGLLLAAMFSAAASYIDGEVNVYAGAITNDCYKAIFKPLASERELLLVGRISSFLIGAVIIGGAVAIPYVGGAEEVILTITSLLVVPMVLPTIWGLVLGKITQKAVWYATGLSFLAAFVVKVGIPQTSDVAILSWLSENALVAEVAVGVIVPFIVLALFEGVSQRTADGFVQLHTRSLQKTDAEQVGSTVAAYPAKLMAYSIGALSVLMYALAFTAGSKAGLVIGFGVVLSVICGLILWSLKKIK
ncbi:Na+:solute symporter [Sphingobacterium sp. SGG-5]|uniref:sodium:solute symporter family transporter n=1 Tax=Sphingobacterium sp. SGG-5 TaxID=2710881 RepID=UPI0013EA53BB|nr:Na+:solute symporter [Sphingobacterium sp. SGG-5]NGM63486.1 Na+:solute symporter [Sphingobacterium sp. SGG-5]